jgi:hypothetical protein
VTISLTNTFSKSLEQCNQIRSQTKQHHVARTELWPAVPLACSTEHSFSFWESCTGNTHDCFNAPTFFSCQLQSPPDPLSTEGASPEYPALSFTGSVEDSLAGSYHSATYGDPMPSLTDLEIEELTQGLDFRNSAFAMTPNIPEPITGSSVSLTFSQNFMIDPPRGELSLVSANHTQMQEDETRATSTDPATSNSLLSSTSSQPSKIHCAWPSCQKSFESRSDYNHHCRYHNLSFQCPSCPARQATKREFDRHVNSVHVHSEKYYCTVSTCNRSLDRSGKPFSREDGCRKHMRRKHRMTDDQVLTCGMDEETKRIRRQRKVARRVAI